MRVRTLLAATAAAVLIPLLPATPAWAHAQLVKTDPADGATVGTALTAVVFTFNENVKQQFSTIVVTGADGVSYSDGSPHAVDKTLTQAVKPLPAGPVQVAWRTVSADGHPVEGRFAFTNAAAATASTPAPAPSTVDAAPAAGDDGPSPWPWAVAGGVLVVLLAGGAVAWRRSGARRSG